MYRIRVPANLSIYVLKNIKKRIYVIKFFNLKYYFLFSIPYDKVFLNFDKISNTLVLSKTLNKFKFNLWIKMLNDILYLFTSFYFKKIKFRGKGYYLYKNKRNTITPQFGYSHRIYLYSYFTKILFLSKTKVFVFGLNKSDILFSILNIKCKRKINIFTLRGVRFSRQIIYKKTGKVSLYR